MVRARVCIRESARGHVGVHTVCVSVLVFACVCGVCAWGGRRGIVLRAMVGQW